MTQSKDLTRRSTGSLRRGHSTPRRSQVDCVSTG